MFLNRVVIGAFEVIGDVMFIRLKVTTRLAFSTQEDNKTRIDNILFGFFIKSK
jgi:hypothetical protein